MDATNNTQPPATPADDKNGGQPGAGTQPTDDKTKGGAGTGKPDDEGGQESKFSQEDIDKAFKAGADKTAKKLAKEQQAQIDAAVKKALDDAQLSEEERTKKQIEEDRVKNEADARKNKVTENTLTLVTDLAGIGITTNAREVAEILVDVDADKTKSNFKAFEKILNDSVEAKVAERLKGDVPTDVNTQNGKTTLDDDKTPSTFI